VKTGTNVSTLTGNEKVLAENPNQNHSCFLESNNFFLASGSEEKTAENLWVSSVSPEVSRE